MKYTHIVMIASFFVMLLLAAFAIKCLLRYGDHRKMPLRAQVFVWMLSFGMIGVMYPVEWTSRWEEVKFFEGGVESVSILRKGPSGLLKVKFVSAVDGSWHTAGVDPVTRVTLLNGVRIPDSIKF